MRTTFTILLLLCLSVSTWAVLGPNDINVEIQKNKFAIFWDSDGLEAGDLSTSNEFLYQQGLIGWHTNCPSSYIGSADSVFDASIAVRFDPTVISRYDGYVLTFMYFYAVDTTASYILEVYQGGVQASNLMASAYVQSNSLSVPGFNYIMFGAPMTIDATLDLWFVMHIDSTVPGTYPAVLDDADMASTFSGYGNLIMDQNGNYVAMDSIQPNCPGNWMLGGYADSPFERNIQITTQRQTEPFPVNPSDIDKIEIRYHVPVNLELPEARLMTLKGYNVYRENVIIEQIRLTDHMRKKYYFGSEEPGSYTYNISYIYQSMYTGMEYESNLSSDINITITDTMEYCPPREVICEVSDGNDLSFTWVHPGEPLGEMRFAQYGDIELADNTMGFNNYRIFEYAVRFDANDLISYFGQNLSNIRVFIPDSLATYKLKIYGGGSVMYSSIDDVYVYDEGILMYEKRLIDPIIGQFNIIDLDLPYTINPNEEIWVSMEVTPWSDLINPVALAGVGGEINNRKGNLFKINEWLPHYDGGINISDEYDNYIQIYISDNDFDAEIDNEENSIESLSEERTNDLTGWYVNMDTGTNDSVSYFVDLDTYCLNVGGVSPGIHNYSVSAAYNSGICVPSEIDSVEVFIRPPRNVIPYFDNEHTITFVWEAPYYWDQSRTLMYYKLYKGDVEDYTQMEFIDSTYVLEYTDTSFGDHPYYFISAVYVNLSSGETWEAGVYLYLFGNDDNELTYETGIKGIYPNPFNPETNVSFNLKKDADVEISVYNMKGQKVKTLKREYFTKGEHVVTWNGKDDNNNSVSSGVYFIRLETGKTQQIEKAILLK